MLSVGMLLMRAGGAWAAPDFSKSEIQVSAESPLEADIVTFTLVLRNSGPDAAEAASVTAQWPLMGFLVSTDGFAGAAIDHQSREIALTVPLAAGAERRFLVRVLAPRDSGGDTLTLTVHAAQWSTQTEYWDHKSVTIDTRLRRRGIVLGPVRVAPAGLVTAALLLAGIALWAVLRGMAGVSRADAATGGTFARLIGPGRAAAAVTVAVGFWTMFGVMAWRDYQSLTRWPETTCTILGGRLSAQAASATRALRGQPSDGNDYVPVLGLEYGVDGRETYSSGYDTGSRLGIGGRGGRLRELSRWTVGAAVPCWYDPADPLDVVVVRGFGGAYVFAFFPVPVFLIGVARIFTLTARRR